MAMNAQVAFLDTTLSLVHIPLPLYSTLLQPILKVLLPDSQQPRPPSPSPSPGTNGAAAAAAGTRRRHHRPYHQPFINVSVTPIECSIVCPTAWATALFEPLLARTSTSTSTDGDAAPTPADGDHRISISRDTYAALCVTSAGMDAGSRVADLTSPLALAGIPIFFITTYYADFILVPTKDRQAVVRTLLAGGFVFSDDDDDAGQAQGRGDVGGIGGMASPVSAPSPSSASVGELQERTFEMLKRRGVVPYVEEGLRLVQCSGRETSAFMMRSGYSDGRRSRGGSGGGAGGGGGGGGGDGSGAATVCWVDTVDAKLYASVVSALVSQPRFLSITLAQEDPPSLLMDRELLRMFGESVVGPTEGALVPIFLNLADLPFEATGIVSGVAGRLVKELRMKESAEMSYLSTARAGAVILSWEESVRALAVLKPLLMEDDDQVAQDL